MLIHAAASTPAVYSLAPLAWNIPNECFILAILSIVSNLNT